MHENKALPFGQVTISDQFWAHRRELVRREMIPYQWKALNDELEDTEPSGSIRNFRIAAGLEEGVFYGCVFQDSDVAKWIESAAFSLAYAPDPALEQTLDELIDLIGKAQQPDGYLNTYFIINGLENRFTNLMYQHELYCCGHFIEAAIAYYRVTGKRKLLEIICRYVDCIASQIGPEDGKKHGYPGHEIIEMALVKLSEVTQEARYRTLAEYFIRQRGQEPNYFEQEIAGRNGEFKWRESPFGLQYYQAGIPVTQQTQAQGHAVRAVYLYSGMADIARLTGDENLHKACRTLFENIVRRQMYITGSIGASSYGESFVDDYELPNDTIYGETCAAIGMVFFAYRMLLLENRSEYADVMERILYNGAISGMSLDGKQFFYVNPLEVTPAACRKDWKYHHIKTQRQKWFKCACCPPNLARMVASISEYVYTQRDDRIHMHLYMSNESCFTLSSGQHVKLAVTTDYPWDGKVSVHISQAESPFTLALRIPGWCDTWSVTRNGIPEAADTEDGYALLPDCRNGDELVLNLDMRVRFVRADPRVRQNAGKIAMMRGPVVYCLEEADNGTALWNLIADPREPWTAAWSDMLGGIMRIQGTAWRASDACQEALYSEAPISYTRIQATWVPYYAWANRGEGEMSVWVREKGL